MSKPMQVIIGIAVLILLVGGSFYAGTVVGSRQAAAAPAAGQFVRPGTRQDSGQFPGAPGEAPGRFAAQPGMRFGQIESIDGDTLVIADPGGEQVRIQVTDTTLIEKNASVTLADLESGETVIVSGSENEDGTITARSVQVAPAGRLGQGGFGGAGQGQ